MITDPLAQPILVYIAVIGIAIFGGLVGYLNKESQIRLGPAALVMFTSGFIGFMTLCVSAVKGYSVAETLLYSGVAGLMGKRVLNDLKQVVYHRMGINKRTDQSGE